MEEEYRGFLRDAMEMSVGCAPLSAPPYDTPPALAPAQQQPRRAQQCMQQHEVIVPSIAPPVWGRVSTSACGAPAPVPLCRTAQLRHPSVEAADPRASPRPSSPPADSTAPAVFIPTHPEGAASLAFTQRRFVKTERQKTPGPGAYGATPPMSKQSMTHLVMMPRPRSAPMRVTMKSAPTVTITSTADRPRLHCEPSVYSAVYAAPPPPPPPPAVETRATGPHAEPSAGEGRGQGPGAAQVDDASRFAPSSRQHHRPVSAPGSRGASRSRAHPPHPHPHPSPSPFTLTLHPHPSPFTFHPSPFNLHPSPFTLTLRRSPFTVHPHPSPSLSILTLTHTHTPHPHPPPSPSPSPITLINHSHPPPTTLL